MYRAGLREQKRHMQDKGRGAKVPHLVPVPIMTPLTACVRGLSLYITLRIGAHGTGDKINIF